MYMFLPQFLKLFSLNFLNLASPGPETALMMHNSSYYSRKVGLFTGFGILCSTIIHRIYSILIFHVVLTQSSLFWLNVLKYIASGYLAYLAVRMFFSPVAEPSQEDSKYITHLKKLTPKKAFKMGFLIDIVHPSSSLGFITILTATVSRDTPLNVLVIYVVLLMCTSLVWYSGSAMLFSHPFFRKLVYKGGKWVNRTMGILMLYFACKLAMRTLES